MGEAEPEPVAYVCRHETPPTLIRPGYACSEDEPVYEPDTVRTVTETRTEQVGGAVRLIATTTITVERGQT